ncbi:hypothetical protein [Paenibacillus sp. SI8]|uniref:hypothetical protein n=1 Tax=unclassified Paenibacillus TaxID=185978 RepID=UPI0034654E3D
MYDIIRKQNAMVSSSAVFRHNPTLHYNGAAKLYEDPADYLPRKSLKGVVIA